MKIWAVANLKGGVAKTTTAVTLASLLAARGRTTLLVDLDPHASATAYLAPDQSTRGGVAALFEGAEAPGPVSIAALMDATGQERLLMLAATPALATFERRFAARAGMGSVLSRALESCDARIDHVIVDCPPTLGLLLINALAAAQRVLIPVQTEHLALEGLKRMLSTLTMIERSQGRPIERLVIPTLYDRRTRASRDALERMREDYAEALWADPVPVDTRLRDAARAGKPAPQYCPGGRAVTVYERLLEALSREALDPLTAPAEPHCPGTRGDAVASA